VSSGAGPPEQSANAAATQAARARVVATLRSLASGPRFALGQQDASAYGVGWWGDADRSDFKSVCGSHPAVHGWDLGRIQNPKNLDGVSFDAMRELIRAAHRRGGINTISFHQDNPLTGGDAWDETRVVHALIPGGSLHQKYREELDRVAAFLASCRGDEGELVPIVFRPFHEHTGSWFWWGLAHATDAEFVSLFRFTVDYLRHERGLGHLLFAFSPAGGTVDSEASYLVRYPGDEYIDVLGLDFYFADDPAAFVRATEIAVSVAEARGKVAAITEFGIQGTLGDPAVDAERWFSQSFLLPLTRSATASRIAYALTWRNSDEKHFFVPFPGHVAAADFRRVCDHPSVVLEDDLPL